MPSEKKSTFQLPPIDHIGLVVKDVDKTAEHYTKIGLGPFHIFEADVKGFVYQERQASHRLKIASGSGRPRIEMTQVLEGETPNADFLQKKGEGISHLGFHVDAKDFDKVLAELAEAGVEPVFHRLNQGRPIAYLNTDKIGGVMIELIGVKKD